MTWLPTSRHHTPDGQWWDDMSNEERVDHELSRTEFWVWENPSPEKTRLARERVHARLVREGRLA